MHSFAEKSKHKVECQRTGDCLAKCLKTVTARDTLYCGEDVYALLIADSTFMIVGPDTPPKETSKFQF